MTLSAAARRVAAAAAEAAAGSANEASLRHVLEAALEKACRELAIAWTPYQLERPLRDSKGRVGFADVVHGAVIIEYEPPASFGGREGAPLLHARAQAEEYADRMAREEGRPITEYVLVAWDGAHVSFGRITEAGTRWERLERFGPPAAERLLTLLRDQGIPLVHPAVLRAVAGPDSRVGTVLIPLLFRAVSAADLAPGEAGAHTRTTLLFREWGRLFGQAVGIETHKLQQYLARQSAAHGVVYAANIPAYLFALHTYIAAVAKLVAALSLRGPSQNVADPTVPLRQRLRVLESGALFRDAGIANMLTGDFFSWYADDEAWPDLEAGFTALLAELRGVSFDLAHKQPESVRDLFKGLYEVFVPRELRHALGEVYTPDWLAEHALDRLDWAPADDLLDPTCGTGTFLLEALKRRMIAAQQGGGPIDPASLLSGVHGIDLNPLAVLGAKASLVVVLSPWLDSAHPVVLPVYLADAINSADVSPAGVFSHELQTELGSKRFEVPEALVRGPGLYPVFDKIRVLVEAHRDAAQVMVGLQPQLETLGLSAGDTECIRRTVEVFAELHGQGWNGIWAPILADRFAAGAIPPVSHVAGNPPWVKWSHLPPAYAEFIKPRCQAMNVFSQDRYVGGIESDISTVVTFATLRKWLAPEGRLAFYITATVFSNESSQGFRKFEDRDGRALAAAELVEDFQSVAPFEGVDNHPALMILRKGRRTDYPVPFCAWLPTAEARPGQQFSRADEFRRRARRECMLARPVPGTDSGPWLKGSREDHEVWASLFDASLPSHYRARKGVTTDLNGVYFVRVEPGPAGREDEVWITNDPSIGRKSGIASVRRRIERAHVFPLLRGRGVSPFRVQPDPEFRIIVPQRAMHGDSSLPVSAPRTYEYLATFEEALRKRGSYRRYQRSQPFWSTWSTGAYTFSPYKVLWKEMPGRRFSAAYVGPVTDAVLGEAVPVPDHKLYFVPVDSEAEAAYLTAILNAPIVARAISAYAAQLSLGVSVVENLKIPPFDGLDEEHLALAYVARGATARGGSLSATEAEELSRRAFRILSEHE